MAKTAMFYNKRNGSNGIPAPLPTTYAHLCFFQISIFMSDYLIAVGPDFFFIRLTAWFANSSTIAYWTNKTVKQFRSIILHLFSMSDDY